MCFVLGVEYQSIADDLRSKINDMGIFHRTICRNADMTTTIARLFEHANEEVQMVEDLISEMRAITESVLIPCPWWLVQESVRRIRGPDEAAHLYNNVFDKMWAANHEGRNEAHNLSLLLDSFTREWATLINFSTDDFRIKVCSHSSPCVSYMCMKLIQAVTMKYDGT